MPPFVQTGTGEAIFGCNIFLHSTLDPYQQHLMTEAPRLEPFVQITWLPASALPERVIDSVDIDNDGVPDAEVAFSVPRDPKSALRAEVKALTQAVKPVGTVTRESFSSAIARVGNAIVVRIPIP